MSQEIEREPQREKIFNLPGVIVALVAVLLAIHALRDLLLTPETDAQLFRTFAYVAGRMTFSFDPDAVAGALTTLSTDSESSQLAIAQYLLGDGSLQWWTPVTYAFLHADWMHVGLNCLWLAVFGAPVALRFGPVRFLALFLWGSILGAFAHHLLHPTQFMPLVGASAGVSAAMAAACRFIFQPGGPLGGGSIVGYSPKLAMQVPAIGLMDSLRDRRVLQFIGVWFVINLAVGLFSGPLGVTSSAIAWEAHIGGFIAGFLCFGWFDPPHHNGQDTTGGYELPPAA